MQRVPNVIAIALIVVFCGVDMGSSTRKWFSVLRLHSMMPHDADDLGHQRETQSAAGLFRRDEGIEQVGSRSSGTGPLSLTQNSSGNDTRDFFPGTERRTPGGTRW